MTITYEDPLHIRIRRPLRGGYVYRQADCLRRTSPRANRAAEQWENQWVLNARAKKGIPREIHRWRTANLSLLGEVVYQPRKNDSGTSGARRRQVRQISCSSEGWRIGEQHTLLTLCWKCVDSAGVWIHSTPAQLPRKQGNS